LVEESRRYLGGIALFNPYSKVRVTPRPEVPAIPRLGLTSDIIGFRRCPRQYGFFVEKGFVPAHTVQIFYGTIIHEVLDRAHHHFMGFENPSTKGKIPNDRDIVNYFNEVEHALKAHGIRSINERLRKQAREILIRFNEVEGPHLYPLVVDTEHRIRGARKEYLMEGVVDVLVGSETDPENHPENPSVWEIWDYKGQKRPEEGSRALQSYEYQMRVYAALYKIRNGCLPKAAKLYFLNELRDDSITSRPSSAILKVSLSAKEIDKALNEFDKTAEQIMKAKENDSWIAPNALHVEEIKDTCTICDLRWSCPAWASKPFSMQFP